LGSTDLAGPNLSSSASPSIATKGTSGSIEQHLKDLIDQVHEINERLGMFAEWATSKIKPLGKQRHDLFLFSRSQVPLIREIPHGNIDQIELTRQHKLVADQCSGLEKIKRNSGRLDEPEKALERLKRGFCNVSMPHRLVGCGITVKAKLIVTELESLLKCCKESMTHLGTIPVTEESSKESLNIQLISTATMVQPILTFIYTIDELETEMKQMVKELTGLLCGLERSTLN